jgi:hypothetical protein
MPNESRESKDWWEWHRPYDEPGSPLADRLAVVQGLVRDALDAAPEGPIRAISICAGQGRDLLGVLAEHPRAPDVRARLVELDERNAEVARRAAGPFPGIDVITGDAASTAAYDGAAPADLVLVCGVFGNITDDDILHTITLLPRLCAPDATVIWTRHRMQPDLTPQISEWFAAAGFAELSLVAPVDRFFAVGAQRLVVEPPPLGPTADLFTFVGYDDLLSR